MRITERHQKEELTEYAFRLAEMYSENYDTKTRKLKGQFFTPGEVSKFMADLFDINPNTIHLLDPGAGTGILTAAFCQRLLKHDNHVSLMIDAYENDPHLLPLLRMTLKTCKMELERKEHGLQYNIHEQDFVLHNAEYFRESGLFRVNEERILYDFVISNPPYRKLNKNSPQSMVMRELISGQPNIYALFMALSTSMVKPGGEMIFITPRSFCSGLYYKRFREWFLKKAIIENIHVFESRREIFDSDEVLQENIIMKARRSEKVDKREDVTISTSKNKKFEGLRTIKVSSIDVISPKNGQLFVRVPASALDLNILHIIDKWPNLLGGLGLEISTGPVVPFRAKEYLLLGLTEESRSVPLLWMHNMQDMEVVPGIRKTKKASGIRICDETLPLLIPVRNYVLVKRFSSKEQKRRLYAAVLLRSKFQYDAIGLENHVNYIHRPNGELSIHEAFGIAAILNTSIIDNFFRSLNGNTQVNATDIRSLPLPSLAHIKRIGQEVYESHCYRNGLVLDNTVGRILRIDDEIIDKLYKGETKYGQN